MLQRTIRAIRLTWTHWHAPAHERVFAKAFRTESFHSLYDRLERQQCNPLRYSVHTFRVASNGLMANKTCRVKAMFLEQLLARSEALADNDFLCRVLRVAVEESNLSLTTNVLALMKEELSSQNKKALISILGQPDLSFGTKEAILNLLNVPAKNIKQHLRQEKNPHLVRAIMDVHNITAHYLESFIHEAQRNNYPIYRNVATRQAMVEALARVR